LPDFCHHKSASLQSAHFSCETGKLSNDSSAQFCSLWGTKDPFADVRDGLKKSQKPVSLALALTALGCWRSPTIV
ncbi:MAG: hypothetical protein K2Y20_13115, partial [Sphingomonas sp.]|nr:hypothetical protein [Sphingomonas sp.]